VDGLRAIAVLSVLLFHVGFPAVSGGFIGVDIFLVISGYLITGIIVRALQEDNFSYWAFMERRVSRLYPALLAVLFLCMGAGFLLFAPEHFKTLGLSTASAFFSLSNFFFWRKAGYFDESSAINPLLHTWSLAVEQQFYIIWPLVIHCIFRRNRAALPWALVAVGAASLLASQWMIHTDSIANYFLMPFRVFEFTAGGLLCLYEKRLPKNKWFRELALIFGIALLVYCAAVFDETTAFPGLNALVPAGGAALCIIGGSATISGHLLRNRVSVFVGRISYSLYLVHWPLIVFYKYYVYRPLDDGDRCLLILASVVLGFVLHTAVENRFRGARIWSRRRPNALIAGAVATCCVILATLAYVDDGARWRIDPALQARFSDPSAFHLNEFGGQGYSAGNHLLGKAAGHAPQALILGDSLARQYARSLDQHLAARGQSWQTSYQDGCFFRAGYTRISKGQPRTLCPQRLAYAMDFLARNPSARLVVALNWGYYHDKISTTSGEVMHFQAAEYERFLLDSISELIQAAGNRPIAILGVPPGSGSTQGLATCAQRPSYLPLTCLENLKVRVPDGNGYAVNARIKTEFSHLANVTFLDPYEPLCDNGLCMATRDNQFIYSDPVHLSKFGAERVIAYFESALF